MIIILNEREVLYFFFIRVPLDFNTSKCRRRTLATALCSTRVYIFTPHKYNVQYPYRVYMQLLRYNSLRYKR